jgi:ribosomal protein S1
MRPRVFWIVIVAVSLPSLGEGVKHVKARHREVRGTLVELNADSVVVQAPDKSRVTLVINDLTIVHKRSHMDHLKDLAVGDRVNIEIMPNDAGTLSAILISVKKPAKRNRSARKPAAVPTHP